MNIIERLKQWYREVFQYTWTKVDDPYYVYKVVERYKHGAKIRIIKRQKKKCMQTGEMRIDGMFLYGERALVEDFDENGNYVGEIGTTTPHPDSEWVINNDSQT